MIKGLRKLHLLIENIFDGLAMILTFKRSPAGNQLENGDASRPNINFLVVPTPAEHLRRPVKESAGNSKHIHGNSPPFMFPADAKINQFQFFSEWIVKNILGFDVPMSN